MNRTFLVAGIALYAAFGNSYAQSVYKCTGISGAITYTDQPCKGQRLQVIHRATDQEMAASAQRQKTDAMVEMLVNGRETEAQAFHRRMA